MVTITSYLLCNFIVYVIAQGDVDLKPDMPFLRVPLNGPAELECCYKSARMLNISWIMHKHSDNITHIPANLSDRVKERAKKLSQLQTYCGTLTFKSAQLNDSGLYQCRLEKWLLSHGTYLQVYKPLEKTINLSEHTKNKILTAEGILLLLCVVLPAVTLLRQSKSLNELEKKKMRQEEENIYQGLNLDDCCTTYDQIERSQTHGPYQDVCNIMEEEEEIQLEKP